MHLYSPERPRFVNSLPMYVTPSGRGIAPITDLRLGPEEDEAWTITAFWCYRQNVARGFEKRCTTLAEAMDFAQAFVEDPELAMHSIGWSWDDSAPSASASKVSVSLEDLGF